MTTKGSDQMVELQEWDRNGPAVLSQYGIDASTPLDLLRLSENATYRLFDSILGCDRVLRLHRPGYRSLPEIRSEIAWVEALQAEGIVRSPSVILTDAGDKIATFHDVNGQEQHAVMLEFIRGGHPDEDDLVGSYVDLGRIAAQLHSHSESWNPNTDFQRPVWDIESAIGTTSQWGQWRDNQTVLPEDRLLFARAEVRIKQQLAAYGRPNGRWGLIHGDMRVANQMICDSELFLIDFDDCGLSWHMWELACSLSFLEDRQDVASIAGAWLEGYRLVRTLDPADLHIVPTLVVLRRLLLVGWLSSRGSAPEVADLAHNFVAASRSIVEDYLHDRYLTI